MSAAAKAKASARGKARWRAMSPQQKSTALARLKGGRNSPSLRSSKSGTSTVVVMPAPRTSYGAKARSYVKKIGLGGMMRRARLTADAMGAGVGVFLRPNDPKTLREKASEAMSRYVGVGFDGDIQVDRVFNNALGLGTAFVDDLIKRKTRHYQSIGQHHILPTLGEGAPYLFAWDAVSAEGKTARERLSDAYDCFVETTDGYVPSTGQYLGLDSDKLKAYLAGSHGGRIASRALGRWAPDVQQAIRDFTGWSL